MRIEVVFGLAGAEKARGAVIVLDVFRAFTVSAYALAGGARECILVRDTDEARRLAAGLPDAVLSAEEEGRPIPGVPISNSPTQVVAADLRGKTLVQRTSAGTQAVNAAAGADRLFAASLVVASATARCLLEAAPPLVTIVATGEPDGHVEDRLCAELLADLLRGRPADPQETARRIAATERCRRLREGATPGFPPSDLDLALAADRFDFAMEATREGGLLKLRGCPTRNVTAA